MNVSGCPYGDARVTKIEAMPQCFDEMRFQLCDVLKSSEPRIRACPSQDAQLDLFSLWDQLPLSAFQSIEGIKPLFGDALMR